MLLVHILAILLFNSAIVCSEKDALKAPLKPKRVKLVASRKSSTSNRLRSAGVHTQIWYGGVIVEKIDIQPIFVGPVRLTDQITKFYKAIVTGNFMKFLTQEYSTPKQTISEGTARDPVTTEDEITTGLTMTEDEITSRLSEMIISGAIPKPSPNVVYSFHFAPGVSIQALDGSKSCNVGGDWCGIHGAYYHKDGATSVKAYYQLIPDFSREFSPDCFFGCGLSSSSTEIDAIQVTTSHEIAETITDPDEAFAKFGWYDKSKIDEIGDYCGDQSASVKLGDGNSYVVQKLWSNYANGCAAPVPHASAPTAKPTAKPRAKRTDRPTKKPTNPTKSPTKKPTKPTK